MKTIFYLLMPVMLFGVDLKVLIDHAENSELAKSYEYEAQSARSAESAVFRGYLPKVTASYTQQSVDKQGTIDAKTTTVGNLKATMVLFDGFRRENLMDEKEAAALSAEYSAKHFKQNQTLDVINLYYACLSLEEDLKAKEQKGKQLEAEVGRLEKFYRAGSVSLDAVERMKASKAMNDYELHTYRLNLDRTRAALETLTGVGIDTLERSTVLEPAVYEFNDRNDIKAMELSVQSLDYKARQSRADYLPTIFIEDSYSTYEYDGLNPAFDLVDEQNKITIGASITLFDFFGKSKEKEAIMLQKKKLESQYAYQKDKAKRDLALAYQSLQTAKSSIDAAHARMTAADKTYEYVNKKFQANVVDNVTYLDALSEKYEAQAMYTRALNNYEYEKAAYYFYASKDIKEFVR